MCPGGKREACRARLCVLILKTVRIGKIYKLVYNGLPEQEHRQTARRSRPRAAARSRARPLSRPRGTSPANDGTRSAAAPALIRWLRSRRRGPGHRTIVVRVRTATYYIVPTYLTHLPTVPCPVLACTATYKIETNLRHRKPLTNVDETARPSARTPYDVPSCECGARRLVVEAMSFCCSWNSSSMVNRPAARGPGSAFASSRSKSTFSK